MSRPHQFIGPGYRLLRPYPQFLNISARQVSEGISRYNAGVIELQKRVTNGWGGRFSYTYSVMKDNQVGESNFYTNNGVENSPRWRRRDQRGNDHQRPRQRVQAPVAGPRLRLPAEQALQARRARA